MRKPSRGEIAKTPTIVLQCLYDVLDNQARRLTVDEGDVLYMVTFELGARDDSEHREKQI
jgi:hypothetical protein